MPVAHELANGRLNDVEQLAGGRSGLRHQPVEALPPKELTRDHIGPVTRGGKSVKGNIVPCCKTCNTQKKYLLPSEWEAYLSRIE